MRTHSPLGRYFGSGFSLGVSALASGRLVARARTLLPLGVLLFDANRRYSGLLGGGSKLLIIRCAGRQSFAEIEHNGQSSAQLRDILV